MDGKHRRHEGTRPEPAGHLPEDQEQEDHRNRVQEDIDRMMSLGPEAEITGSPVYARAR